MFSNTRGKKHDSLYIVRGSHARPAAARDAKNDICRLRRFRGTRRCKMLIETSTPRSLPTDSPILLAPRSYCSYTTRLSFWLYVLTVLILTVLCFPPLLAKKSRDARVSKKYGSREIIEVAPLRRGARLFSHCAYSWYLSMRTVSILPPKSRPLSVRMAFMACVSVAYRTVP